MVQMDWDTKSLDKGDGELSNEGSSSNIHLTALVEGFWVIKDWRGELYLIKAGAI